MNSNQEAGQLQVLEAIIVAIFIFVAIAVASIFSLPSNPSTFQAAELLNLGGDALKVRAARVPPATADCNETPCPFSNELERMVSVALGYVGDVDAVGVPDPEEPSNVELKDYLDQALPEGSRYIVSFSNGYETTQLYPVGLTPPVARVGVARSLLSPNWSVYAEDRAGSVLLRIGETSHIPAGETESFADPLNRASRENGERYVDDLFTPRVPNWAILGTYRACVHAPCTTQTFTVVTDGIFGAGGQVLASDRNHTAFGNLKTLPSDFLTSVKYWDRDGTVGLGPEDPLYLDVAGLGTISAGDVRVSRTHPGFVCRSLGPCYEGSYVRSADGDEGELLTPLPLVLKLSFRDLDGDSVYSEGDAIYLDQDGDNAIDEDDRRVTRYALFPAGSPVATGDLDFGALLKDEIPSQVVYFDDTDNSYTGPATPSVGEGEPVFLDTDGNGLGLIDVYLSQIGAASHRYYYDLKLAIWFAL